LPLDAPTGFLEHLEDVVLFQSGEGFDDLAFKKTVPTLMKSTPFIYSIHEQGNYVKGTRLGRPKAKPRLVSKGP
jgi:hypothetical protein